MVELEANGKKTARVWAPVGYYQVVADPWNRRGLSVVDTRRRCSVKARGVEASRTRWINKLRDLEGSRSCRVEPTDGLEDSRNRWIDKTNCLNDSRSLQIDRVMVGRIPGADGLTKPTRWRILEAPGSTKLMVSRARGAAGLTKPTVWAFGAGATKQLVSRPGEPLD